MQESKLVNSVYIHIPFCKNICSYCDFCKNYYNKKIVIDYLKELKKDVEEQYGHETLNTIYIGGGTPSCLSNEELKLLFEITGLFKLEEVYEFTFECNYEDITDELLIKLKENKINRLSIGIQTFNEKYSAFLERKIDKKKMIEKVNLSKKYFDNINVDLMYAIGDETFDELKQDIEEFIKLDVSHISTYALIKEEHTKLNVSDFKEVDDELQARMYYEIINKLNQGGYNQYEISNFSKIGYESKHNMVYWNNNNYYGFGAGASGFIKNVRYDNTKSVFNYISGNRVLSKEVLTTTQLIDDEIMLNLRKTSGINKKDFQKKYGTSIDEVFNLSLLIKDGLIVEKNNNIFIAKKYLFVCNEIILLFLQTKDNKKIHDF